LKRTDLSLGRPPEKRPTLWPRGDQSLPALFRGASLSWWRRDEKEKLTAHEIAGLIEERIGRRAAIMVMGDHPMNGWHAQVLAPGNPKILELQAEVDKISDGCAGDTTSKAEIEYSASQKR
jgi:hypothetical protein